MLQASWIAVPASLVTVMCRSSTRDARASGSFPDGHSVAMAASTSRRAARRAGQVAAARPKRADSTKNTAILDIGTTTSVIPCCLSESANATPNPVPTPTAMLAPNNSVGRPQGRHPTHDGHCRTAPQRVAVRERRAVRERPTSQAGSTRAATAPANRSAASGAALKKREGSANSTSRTASVPSSSMATSTRA